LDGFSIGPGDDPGTANLVYGFPDVVDPNGQLTVSGTTDFDPDGCADEWAGTAVIGGGALHDDGSYSPDGCTEYEADPAFIPGRQVLDVSPNGYTQTYAGTQSLTVPSSCTQDGESPTSGTRTINAVVTDNASSVTPPPPSPCSDVSSTDQAVPTGSARDTTLPAGLVAAGAASASCVACPDPADDALLKEVNDYTDSVGPDLDKHLKATVLDFKHWVTALRARGGSVVHLIQAVKDHVPEYERQLQAAHKQDLNDLKAHEQESRFAVSLVASSTTQTSLGDATERGRVGARNRERAWPAPYTKLAPWTNCKHPAECTANAAPTSSTVTAVQKQPSANATVRLWYRLRGRSRLPPGALLILEQRSRQAGGIAG
jgi:hypothetical protein